MPIITPAVDFDQYLGSPTGISAYAHERTDATDAYILQLGVASASLAPPVINPSFPVIDAAPLPITAATPTMEPVVWTAPALPTAFSGTVSIDDLMPAAFTDDAPLLVFPGAPASFSGAVPDAPPVDTNFTMPTLSYTLPAPPNLLSLSIASFSGLDLPTLDFSIPELTVAAPDIREYTPGAQYTSALLTAVQTSLLDRIENGGTGISLDVENAIWDRGREREYRAQRDALDDLERMETLGYAFPPGVYVDARLKILTETDYAARGHSREVMIKAAELEQENVKHALTSAIQLESTLINYSNQIEQRLFDSCKYATEAGIAIYNARVQAYAALVDAYKARVEIYRAQIQGEIAKVEAYKAQIDAEQAKATINTALVEQYRVQTEVALSAIEAYKAQVGAIQVQAEIEKLKIEIYGEQVRAYSAQVGAYTAGVEGYRASIQAEGVKQDAFRSRVDAYKAQVQAGAAIAEARINEFRGRLEAKSVEWEGYKSAYQGEAARATAITANNQTAAEAYRSTITGLAAYNEVLTKQWQASIEQAQRVAEIGVSAAKANGELYMTTRSLALDAAKVGAQVSAQLGAAALNAINWSQSYNTSWSTGVSYNNSESDSNSTSYSVSENYNYSV